MCKKSSFLTSLVLAVGLVVSSAHATTYLEWGSEIVDATASSVLWGLVSLVGPQTTVDGSGMDGTGLWHDNHVNGHGMWLTDAGGQGDTNPHPGTRAGAAWIAYEFDQIYELQTLWIWNDNQQPATNRGLKNVYIEYSITGGSNPGEWTTLMDDANDYFVFTQASGDDWIEHTDEVDFGGAEAKYVVITAHTTNGNYGSDYYGLSEVRFHIDSDPTDPNLAYGPSPGNGSECVVPNVVLSWSSGVSANSHDVYFGTDYNDVNDATVLLLDGDVDENGQVGLADLSLLHNQWLQDGSSQPSANLNNDGNVNLFDYAIVANDWWKSVEYKGNQPLNDTSYVPAALGGLELGRTYYWRIDEVNGLDVWKGGVWKFTVKLVELADEWTNLFRRTSGWTGADGVFSIPYSGVEAPGSAGDTKTLITFGDTFLGEVDPVTRQRLYPPTVLVNTTLAVLDGGEPNEDNITFIYGPNGNGTYDNVFVPTTPDSTPSSFYWLQDGLALDGKIHLFPLLMEWNPPPFAVVGITRISIPLDPCAPYGLDFENHTQIDTPLYLPAGGGHGEIIFANSCIMPNTEEAGAPYPDGYLYIYGWLNDSGRYLIASRVLPEDFEDFNDWRYWDGSSWSSDIEDTAGITDHVSVELSVSPLSNGKYILVFQEDTIGRYVACRIGDSPVGPFGEIIRIYYTPEPDIWPGEDISVYNAKAHPHLSKPGELLISYNVNGGEYAFENAEVYRPRWLRLPLAPVIDPNY